MAEVVTFVGYRPPVRYDAVPWTQVRIQESATEDGTYTQLEANPLRLSTRIRRSRRPARSRPSWDRPGLLVPGCFRRRHRRHFRADHAGAEHRRRQRPDRLPVRRRGRGRPGAAAAGGDAGAGGGDAAGDPGGVSKRSTPTSPPTPPSSRPTRRWSCRSAWSGRSSIGSRSSPRSGWSTWAATRCRRSPDRNSWRRHAQTLLPLKTSSGVG